MSNHQEQAMSADSGTPRTDAVCADQAPIYPRIADFARTLEREAAALRADRDALADALRELLDIEGPQPGTAGWANRARQALSKHGGTK